MTVLRGPINLMTDASTQEFLTRRSNFRQTYSRGVSAIAAPKHNRRNTTAARLSWPLRMPPLSPAAISIKGQIRQTSKPRPTATPMHLRDIGAESNTSFGTPSTLIARLRASGRQSLKKQLSRDLKVKRALLFVAPRGSLKPIRSDCAILFVATVLAADGKLVLIASRLSGPRPLS